MNLKTKIFTLIVAGLLVVPVLFNPPKSNSVLGVSEKNTQSTQATQSPQTTKTQSTPSQPSSTTASSNNSNTSSNQTQASEQSQANNQPSNPTPTNQTTQQESSGSTSKQNNSLKPNIGLPKINLNLGNLFSRNNTNLPKPSNFQIKDITSGVREKVADEAAIVSDNNPEARGYIQWEPSATTSIVSNKYQLGSSIQVNTTNKNGVNLVISKVQALPVDTILVVDQNTFIKLGGDPQTQKEILGTISMTN